MKKKLKVEAIVPVAGMGTRLKMNRPKPFVFLNQKPLFYYALRVLDQSRHVDRIILVAHHQFVETFKRLVKKYRFKKVKAVVNGGKTRQHSVYNGLQSADDDTDIILIHDGARPFITADMIERSVSVCRQKNAVIVGVPIKPTVKRVNKALQVVETLNRTELWEVQTPQVFKKDLLIKAHQHGKKLKATDDAFLVEKLGVKVNVIQGSYDNIKITTKEDLDFAEILLRKSQ